MRRLLSASFRNRLFAALLAASLIPLLLCSALLLQIFRLRMEDRAQGEADGYLDSVGQTLDQACRSFSSAAAALERDGVLSQALLQGSPSQGEVYRLFLEDVQSAQTLARLDLYDSQGNWYCSTRSAAGRSLSPQWGVLYQARERAALTFVAPEDPGTSNSPVLVGSAPLAGPDGAALGFLLVSFYQSDLHRLLDGAVGDSCDLLLLSPYWRAVYCSQPALADSLADDLRRRLLDGEPLSGAGEEFSYPVVQDEATGLYVILRQPQVFDRGTMNILYTISLSSALVCLALAVVLSLALSRQLFQPIQRLHKAIREVAHNNLDVYVPHEHNDELGQLADRFNDMLVALKRNQEQLLENQRERNEAQIRMLQAQLNPHFLCNTLDTMKWISKIHHVPQVADMSTNLADILRFCISPEEFVPLRRETEIVARYVEIQRIRLSGSFAFVLDIPPELEEALVPKMMLQPIVENALLHGLSGQPDGAVEVRARREGAVLRLTVLDNGVGLPPELEGPYACRDQEETRGHLGLYNVDTILRKHYGEQFGLCLENRPDGTGTMVTATLPLRYKEDASSC